MKDIVNVFESVHKELTGKTTDFSVSFYPYVGIKSTIRLKNGIYHVKLGEVFKEAPHSVLRALAFILVSKITGKACRAKEQRLYKRWTSTEYASKLDRESRQARQRKVKVNPNGKNYDLREIFYEINKKYFEGVLTPPLLTWGRNRTRRKLGHYDAARHLILISRTLDSGKVPQFVLEYVMYHEMLHIFHGREHKDLQQRVHTARFKKDEKRFEQWKEAEEWLKRLSR